MKNPNHYGTITKLSGKRRRPFVIKEGKTGTQRIIGYAETREDAIIFLANYNKNPWDIDSHKVTLQELFDLWLEKRAVKLGKSNAACLKSAYKHCISLANIQYNEIKSYQMQDTIDSCGKGYSTQGIIKNLWGHLDHFAMELDIVQKTYSDLLTSAPIPETTKTIFTDEEVDIIWENKFYPYADTILFLLYTGFRISEMLDLRIENIDLNAETIQGGTKTDAGKNRIVPIHSKIKYIVENHYNKSKNGYLFEYQNDKININKYREIWSKIMSDFNMQHTPHECRHTFRSRLDSAGANKVCIDRIMGHKSKGTGERIYTHKNINELKMNIELITN